jgi:hypothetical protein
MLDNVYLVPLGLSSDLLLRRCLMTASITGSVVWQGLELGKPGCTFGHVWHSDCDSSPDLSTRYDIKYELSKLLEKTKEDVESDRLNFIRDFQKNAFQGSNSYLNAISTPSGYSRLVSSMANEVVIRSIKVLNLEPSN